jgi:hypothetical protein
MMVMGIPALMRKFICAKSYCNAARGAAVRMKMPGDMAWEARGGFVRLANDVLQALGSATN